MTGPEGAASAVCPCTGDASVDNRPSNARGPVCDQGPSASARRF